MLQGLRGLEAGVDADPNLGVGGTQRPLPTYASTPCPNQGSRTIRTEVSLPASPTSQPCLFTTSRAQSSSVWPTGLQLSPVPRPIWGYPEPAFWGGPLTPLSLSAQQNYSRDELRVSWKPGIGFGAHPAAPQAG